MHEEAFFALPPTPVQVTPLYGLRPRGEGTGDIESQLSYFLRLAHEHRLTPKKVIEVSLPPVAAGIRALSGWKFGWAWESDAGKDLVGPGVVSNRWTALLGAATGQRDLEVATLNPLASHAAGDLSTNEERVCLQCLSQDIKDGELPYGRLLWRLRAVTCCPIHRRALVAPKCGRAEVPRPPQCFRVKLSGICGHCGSIGHRCAHGESEDATDIEVWRAEQCRQVIAAFPTLAQTEPRAAANVLKAYCARAQPGHQTSLALRSGMAPATLSRWLNKPHARIWLDGLLDIAAAEGLSLAALLLGRIEPFESPTGLSSSNRQKRTPNRVDHLAVRQALADAITNGEKVTEVAQRLRVDVATLARHKDLYTQVRNATRARKAAADLKRQQETIARAESVAMRLIGTNKRLTRRNASSAYDRTFHSETTATVLALIRIGLGDRTTRYPALARRMGEGFLGQVDLAVQRVKAAAGDRQGALALIYR